jgi:hypothetical protein
MSEQVNIIENKANQARDILSRYSIEHVPIEQAVNAHKYVDLLLKEIIAESVAARSRFEIVQKAS